MSPSDTLRVAVQAQSQQDNNPQVVDKCCSEIKDSAAVQYSAPDFIQSCAVASCAAAACMIASSSESAQGVKLPSSSYTSFDMLNANLIECSSRCRVALLQTEQSFSLMNQATVQARNKTMDLIQCLGEPEAARKLLKTFMQQLKESTNTCAREASQINQKYDEWFGLTSDMYSACVAVEGSEDEKKRAGDYALLLKRTHVEDVDTNAAAEKLGKQVSSVSDAFKKASEKLPMDWQIGAGTIVRGLADSIAAATTQYHISCLSNFNVSMRAADGMQLQKSLCPGEDAAYNSALKDLPFFHCLVRLADGPDWKQISGSIDFLISVLSNGQEQFKAVATTSTASTDLLKVYADAAEVASAMKKANGTADSEQVKSWQAFKSQYTRAVELGSVARGLPGWSPLSLPLMADDEGLNQMAAQADATSAPALAVVEGITNQWTAAHAGRQNLKVLYGKRSQVLEEQEKQLYAVTSKLNTLCENKMGLAEIKTVLETNLKMISNMKLSAVSYYAFFKSLAATIDAIIRYTVPPFLADIQAQNAAKVGSYTYGDHLRSTVFQQTTFLRAQYAVFSDITGMWVASSQRTMLPSLQLLDKMSMVGPEPTMQRRVWPEIKALTEGALKYAREIASGKQEQLSDKLEQRTGEAETITKQLPPTEESKKAIEAGAGVAFKAAEEALTFNASMKPLMKDV